MKLKTLALATSLALSAASMAGAARADALSTAVLDITNFEIQQGGTALDYNDGTPGDFTFLLPGDTADISAGIGTGAPATDSDSTGGTGINLAPVSQGSPPAYTPDSFAVLSHPPEPTSTYALADQIIEGSPIQNLFGQPLGAEAGHAAYVGLDSVSTGSSSANNSLSSSWQFSGISGSIDFVFDARAYLEAYLSADQVYPAGVTSSYSLVFNITDVSTGGNTVVHWAPDGSGTGGTGISLVGLLDPFSLNDTRSANAPINGTFFAGAGLGIANIGSFSASSSYLFNSTDTYSLSIRSTATADATTVPEPATLALLGLGVLGLGVSRRRIRA